MKNWYWYIIGIIIIIVLTKQCEDYNSKVFRNKINALEIEVDSLKKVNDSVSNRIKFYSKKAKQQEQISESLIQKIESNYKKQDEILNDVRDYDERELDSILTNYRHIERTKN